MDIIHQTEVEKRQVNDRQLQWFVAENGAFQSELCACCIVELPPGSSAKPPHSHTNEEEVIYVLEGRGEIIGAGGERNRIIEGSLMIMRRNEIHMLNNIGNKNLKAICFYSSNTDVSQYTFHPMSAVGMED